RAPARVIPAASVPRVEVRGLVVDYPGRGGLLRRGAPKRALNGIDLSVQADEILAVVGGSGSGKTTLGRTIAGLVAPTAGEIRRSGAPVGTSRASDRAYRLNCQRVFQDPYSSLDPRMTIGAL